jgi:hypothetical protein
VRAGSWPVQAISDSARVARMHPHAPMLHIGH